MTTAPKPDPLPCAVCDAECCHLAPFTRSEFKAARRKYGVPKDADVVEVDVGSRMATMVFVKGTTRCAYLVGNRCSIYDCRPHVCRLYGTVPGMPCIKLDRLAGREISESAIAELGIENPWRKP